MSDSDNKQIQKADNNTLSVIGKEIEDAIITRPNCKVCTSDLRAQAENEYERTKGNITMVHKLLIDGGDQISYESVRRHFSAHYERQKLNIMVKDYIDNVAKFKIDTVSRKKSLEDRRTLLTKMMIEVGAKNEGVTGGEEYRKNIEAARKLSDSITAIEAQLEEMEKGLEPVMIIVQNAQRIITEKIQQANSENVKKALLDVLEQLSKSVEGIQVDKKG